MSSIKGSIKRLGLILDKIEHSHFPTHKEIQTYLEGEGFELSNRTIQRDFEELRYEFGIEIVYDRSQRGYYIDKDKSAHFEPFLYLIEMAETANILTETLKEGKKALDYIDFESAGVCRGSEYLKTVLSAIREHKIINIEYTNFEGHTGEYSIEPYMLKEYQNRWYVIAIPNYTDELRTFGLDRIGKLDVTNKKFKVNDLIDAKQLFYNTVGLTYSINKLEEIELSITPRQGKYIKTLPFHHSQEILRDDEEEFRIKLLLIPNFEFTQKLLMQADYLKVIKPKWLADEMKGIYERAGKRYE